MEKTIFQINHEIIYMYKLCISALEHARMLILNRNVLLGSGTCLELAMNLILRNYAF